MSKEILNPPGLIGEIARWVDSCSVHPCRLLSVGAALSAVSTLAGRRYCLPGGLRTCTYVVGLAKSGVGKEVGRQCVISLLDRCTLRQRLGTGAIASGAGLVERLVKSPIQLFLLDEFGRMLEGFSSKNAGNHEREIMTIFMELWGASDGVFLGKAYAEKDAPVVEMPHTVIYGTSTPSSFWGAIHGKDVVDGVMSRMIILEADHDQLAAVKPTGNSAEPPPALIEACKALARGPPNGNLDGIDTSKTRSQPLIIPMSDLAQIGADKIGAGITAHLPREEHRDLWVRGREQALRVALAVAVGCSSARVEDDHLRWAWDLVRWSLKATAAKIAGTLADTEEGRCQLAVRAALDAAGGTCTAGELARHKDVRKYDKRTRKTALDELLDAAVIEVRTSGVTANGRALSTYAYIKPDEYADDLPDYPR